MKKATYKFFIKDKQGNDIDVEVDKIRCRRKKEKRSEDGLTEAQCVKTQIVIISQIKFILKGLLYKELGYRVGTPLALDNR